MRLLFFCIVMDNDIQNTAKHFKERKTKQKNNLKRLSLVCSCDRNRSHHICVERSSCTRSQSVVEQIFTNEILLTIQSFFSPMWKVEEKKEIQNVRKKNR